MKFIERYCIKAVKCRYCSLPLKCVLSLFWCSEKSTALNLLFCLILFVTFLLTEFCQTDKWLKFCWANFASFLTNERCHWLSLSTFTPSMGLGSNLFYLVSEFLFSMAGDSFEAVGSSGCFKHCVIDRVGYFCCPFSHFSNFSQFSEMWTCTFFSRATCQDAHEVQS